MSYRRKENMLKKIVKLVIIGFAIYGGYLFYTNHQPQFNKAEAKAKNVWSAATK